MQHKNLREVFREAIQNREGRGLSIVNVDDDTAEIRIYDVIGWPFIEAQDVAAELDQISAANITVAINSPGGDIFEAVAIYNLLRQNPAKVTTRVDGIAASAASIIAQGGDNRVMVSGSQMMIHKAWTIALGNADEMAKVAEVLGKQDSIIAGIYAERADGAKDVYAGLMAEESWFDADETVEHGLADDVVVPTRVETPADQIPSKFVDQLTEAVASVEQVAARAGEVIAFRSEQGKTPLSDEAVALVDRATAALSELKAEPDVPEDPPEPPVEGRVLSELDRRRYEWQGKRIKEAS